MFRRSARTFSLIHSALARDLASVVVRDMHDSEASLKSSLGVALSLFGNSVVHWDGVWAKTGQLE